MISLSAMNVGVRRGEVPQRSGRSSGREAPHDFGVTHASGLFARNGRPGLLASGLVQGPTLDFIIR